MDSSWFVLFKYISTNFLAILLGADKVTGMIEAVPNVILDGLSVAGNLLPAIGFALLLDMLFFKEKWPPLLFSLGFFSSCLRRTKYYCDCFNRCLYRSDLCTSILNRRKSLSPVSQIT